MLSWIEVHELQQGMTGCKNEARVTLPVIQLCALKGTSRSSLTPALLCVLPSD